jgi:uncharacterized protein involved in exopolysaccharide biosynthesis
VPTILKFQIQKKVYSTKEIAQEIRQAAKRRKKLLIITPVFFLILSIAALLVIDPMYKSTTSILVQKEEALNPLVLYQMAVNLASEDRLQSFNEIVYSRSTMLMLIDSLKLDMEVMTESEKQKLILEVRQNVATSSRASNSFEISYFDTDPIRARNGVELLANHFIQTRVALENRRNNETVDFFSNKLDELEQVVGQQRDQIVSATTNLMKELPFDSEVLRGRLQDLEREFETLEWDIYQEEQKLEILYEYRDKEGQESREQILYKLPFNEIAHGEELSSLMVEFEQLSMQFTDNYPPLKAVIARISDVVNRIPSSIESRLETMNIQKEELIRQRNQLIRDMEKAFIVNQRNSSHESDFSIYQELYNSMKVKLEQARMTRDIDDRAIEQFIVLDAPYIPEKPSSPNKKLVLSIGLFLGLMVGVILSGVAEIMDTTVRNEEDLEFTKPIIAYLVDG